MLDAGSPMEQPVGPNWTRTTRLRAVWPSLYRASSPPEGASCGLIVSKAMAIEHLRKPFSGFVEPPRTLSDVVELDISVNCQPLDEEFECTGLCYGPQNAEGEIRDQRIGDKQPNEPAGIKVQPERCVFEECGC